jgi:hypothetical protein
VEQGARGEKQVQGRGKESKREGRGAHAQVRILKLGKSRLHVYDSVYDSAYYFIKDLQPSSFGL